LKIRCQVVWKRKEKFVPATQNHFLQNCTESNSNFFENLRNPLKIPKNWRIFVWIWHTHFWRCGRYFERMTLNPKVQGPWGRISVFQIQKRYPIFKKFQELGNCCMAVTFAFLEIRWASRKNDEFYFSKSQKKRNLFLKNYKKLKNGHTEWNLHFLEVRWISQMYRVQFQRSYDSWEVFHFLKSQVKDTWILKSSKKLGMVVRMWHYYFCGSNWCL